MAGFWDRVATLEMVELYAEDNGQIASEEELSKIFDESILPLVLETYSESDSVAINEAFNDWTDSLCKDGELHPDQYNSYCYVGRLADDD
jgi:hypothetical protein